MHLQGAGGRETMVYLRWPAAAPLVPTCDQFSFHCTVKDINIDQLTQHRTGLEYFTCKDKQAQK